MPFVERHSRVFEYAMSPEEQALYDDVTAWLMREHLYAFRGKPAPPAAHQLPSPDGVVAAGAVGQPRARRGALARSAGPPRLCRLGRRHAVPPRDGGRPRGGRALGRCEDDETPRRRRPRPSTADLRDRRGHSGRARSGRAIRRTARAAWARQQGATTPRRAAIRPGTGIAGAGLRQGRHLHRVADDAGLPAQAAAGTRLRPGDVTLFRGDNDGPDAARALEHWEADEGHAIAAGASAEPRRRRSGWRWSTSSRTGRRSSSRPKPAPRA